jgi:hypothetical protein
MRRNIAGQAVRVNLYSPLPHASDFLIRIPPPWPGNPNIKAGQGCSGKALPRHLSLVALRRILKD